jgi:hypothetical protein
MAAAPALAPYDPADEPGPIQHRKVMPSTDFAGMLRQVTARTGKSYFAQLREIVGLAAGPGKLSPMEYFFYGLYDDAIAPARKAAYVGNKARAEIVNGYFDRAVFEVGLDKLAFYARAAELGLPTPRTVALCHAERTFPGAAALTTAAELADFLRDAAVYPLFGKPNKMTASVGTASLARLHAAADEIEMGDGRRFPVARIADELARYFAGGYLLQGRLDPHPQIRAVSGATLSTVRMMALDLGQGPQLIAASWRVPVGENQADVSWRGNIMAAIDPASGRAVRAVRGRGLERVAIATHPDSGETLVGLQLPDWDAACALILRAAAGFPELPLTGWDLALTDKGPVLIELEPDGGDPSVAQSASGRGLLEGPYKAFVAQCRKRGKVRQPAR